MTRSRSDKLTAIAAHTHAREMGKLLDDAKARDGMDEKAIQCALRRAWVAVVEVLHEAR